MHFSEDGQQPVDTAQGRSKGPTAQAELEEWDMVHGQELSAGPGWRSFAATESRVNWITGDGSAAFLRKPKRRGRFRGAFHRKYRVLKF